MVDIDSHQIIDLIESRDSAEVTKWLKSYNNLKIISRDGSIPFNNAISEAHSEAMQISDRFHLLKNLTDYSKEYLKIKFKPYIILSEKQTTVKAQAETNDKYKTVRQMEHEQKISQKAELIKEVRKFKKLGISKREISRKTGLSRKSIDNYLNKDFSPVYASYGTKRSGKLSPFFNYIDNCIEKGITGVNIEKELRLKGYVGSSSNIRYYITNYKKQQCFKINNIHDIVKETSIIKRTDLFKLLYNPIEKVKEINSEQFSIINKKYPFFEKIYSLIHRFKKILKEKNISDFAEWLKDARKLEVEKINSFINGIERDKSAVENAIIYEYSNGLAEGSVNKLKVIKRIMYGRCSFNTLRLKVLKLEELRYIN